MRLQVRNLKALKQVDFSPPEGVSVLIGMNATGKTTLLRVWQFVAEAYSETPQQALPHVFGDPSTLKHRDASPRERVTIQMDIEPDEPLPGAPPLPSLAWSYEPEVVNNVVRAGASLETLKANGGIYVQNSGDDNAVCGGRSYPLNNRLAVRAAADANVDRAVQFGLFVSSLYSYATADFDLGALREKGSPSSGDAVLDRDGLNAFSVLQTWRLENTYTRRYEFVQKGLRSMFGSAYEQIDLQHVSQRVFLRFYSKRWKAPFYAGDMANGPLHALLNLTAVASGSPGGLVSLDEPETALHPAAIKEFVRLISEYAAENKLRVVLATHSPVVLDCFGEEPERVFVMDVDHEILPAPLDSIKKAAWLKQFSLGLLFSTGEFAGPDP